MTPLRDRLEQLRKRLDWSRATLANFLGVTERTVMRWEHGEYEAPATAARVVEALWAYTDSEERIAHVREVASTGNVKNLVQEALAQIGEKS